MSVFALARQTIRVRKPTFAAAFVAVFAGSALITASGVLFDSGLRGAALPPQRYAAAAVVVTADQIASTEDGITQRFAERVPLPVARADDIARVPGVASVVPDVSATAVVRGGAPLVVHGWSSSRLGSTTLTSGRPPQHPDEIVLDGAPVGAVIDLAVGGVASPYRVVGTVAAGQPTVFLHDERARVVAGHPDAVDAIAVLAEPGVDAADLARRIGQAVPGVATATGDDRAGAEFLDVGAARSFLTLVASSFGGAMLMIVLLVVASTLGLANQQRRREFALLRAIAAGPKHVYQLIGIETALVATVAAVLGVFPGVGLSLLLHDAFVRLGSIPAGFEFVIGPLPVFTAVVGSVVAAVAAGLITARRAARISPVDALGEAAVEPPELGRGRVVTGWVLAITGTFGVDLGGMVALRLGDGTARTAHVVAVYGNGLGFGDLTLPHDAVAGHTTSGLDDEVLVAGAPGADFLRAHPEIRVADRQTFATAQNDAAGAQSTVNLVLNLVLIAFIAIAVVNILVLATAARVREFALLRLVGAKPRQVRAMTRGEAGIVVVAAIVLGSLAALPPLVGISLSLTGTALPTVPPLLYAGILAAAALVGWGAIAIPTRFALRPAAVAAMRVGD